MKRIIKHCHIYCLCIMIVLCCFPLPIHAEDITEKDFVLINAKTYEHSHYKMLIKSDTLYIKSDDLSNFSGFNIIKQKSGWKAVYKNDKKTLKKVLFSDGKVKYGKEEESCAILKKNDTVYFELEPAVRYLNIRLTIKDSSLLYLKGDAIFSELKQMVKNDLDAYEITLSDSGNGVIDTAKNNMLYILTGSLDYVMHGIDDKPAIINGVDRKYYERVLTSMIGIQEKNLKETLSPDSLITDSLDEIYEIDGISDIFKLHETNNNLYALLKANYHAYNVNENSKKAVQLINHYLYTYKTYQDAAFNVLPKLTKKSTFEYFTNPLRQSINAVLKKTKDANSILINAKTSVLKKDIKSLTSIVVDEIASDSITFKDLQTGIKSASYLLKGLNWPGAKKQGANTYADLNDFYRMNFASAQISGVFSSYIKELNKKSMYTVSDIQNYYYSALLYYRLAEIFYDYCSTYDNSYKNTAELAREKGTSIINMDISTLMFDDVNYAKATISAKKLQKANLSKLNKEAKEAYATMLLNPYVIKDNYTVKSLKTKVTTVEPPNSIKPSYFYIKDINEDGILDLLIFSGSENSIGEAALFTYHKNSIKFIDSDYLFGWLGDYDKKGQIQGIGIVNHQFLYTEGGGSSGQRSYTYTTWFQNSIHKDTYSLEAIDGLGPKEDGYNNLIALKNNKRISRDVFDYHAGEYGDTTGQFITSLEKIKPLVNTKINRDAKLAQPYKETTTLLKEQEANESNIKAEAKRLLDTLIDRCKKQRDGEYKPNTKREKRAAKLPGPALTSIHITNINGQQIHTLSDVKNAYADIFYNGELDPAFIEEDNNVYMSFTYSVIGAQEANDFKVVSLNDTTAKLTFNYYYDNGRKEPNSSRTLELIKVNNSWKIATIDGSNMIPHDL